jgi:8-oxo-dGTP pyrophosphatase MutT (NUDIX family)
MAAPAEWNVLNEAVLADCKVFKVFKRRFQHPHDKREGDFFVINSGDWVQALAVTPERKLVFVRQFRVGNRALSWEPPGGIIEAGEDPVTGGLRELAEETGYTGRAARLIGSCSPNPALFNNTSHFVLVEDCVRTQGLALDPDEEVETVLFAPLEIEAMMLRGEMPHALAQTGLYHLRLARPDLFAK